MNKCFPLALSLLLLAPLGAQQLPDGSSYPSAKKKVEQPAPPETPAEPESSGKPWKAPRFPRRNVPPQSPAGVGPQNPQGLLTRLGPEPGQVEFSGQRRFEVDAKTFAELQRRGLGTNWQLIFTPSGEQISRVVFLNANPDLQRTVQQMKQFADAIEQRRYAQAHGMMTSDMRATLELPRFTEYWESDYLSPDPCDWRLKSWSDSGTCVVYVESIVPATCPKAIHGRRVRFNFYWSKVNGTPQITNYVPVLPRQSLTNP